MTKTGTWMLAGAALAGLLCVGGPANATLTVFTDEASWLAAVSGVTTEDFEASPLGDLAAGTTDIGAFSITIDNNADASVEIRDGGSVNGTREFQGDIETDGTMVIDFGSFGASIAGFAGSWSSTTSGDLLTMTVDGITVEFDDFLSGSGNGFLGVVSSNPFSTVSFGTENPSTFGEAFQLDNALIATGRSAAVAEPAMLGLLGAGMLGLGLVRRRTRARS